jgi:hypothetical protein
MEIPNGDHWAGLRRVRRGFGHILKVHLVAQACLPQAGFSLCFFDLPRAAENRTG